MEVQPMAYLENCKRYWRRRRKYQRLSDTTSSRKKMKTARLGTKVKRGLKLRLSPKLIISPIKQYLTKFYTACIDHMIITLLGRKKLGSISGPKDFPKHRPFVIPGTNNEVVDGRFILEIYKRMVANGELIAVSI